MNALLQFDPGFLKEAAVLALVGSLWQGALVVIAIWFIKRIFKLTPLFQYFLSISGLFSVVLLSLLTFQNFTMNPSESSVLSPLGLELEASSAYWIFTLWMIGAFIFFTRFLLSHIFLKKVIQKAQVVNHHQWLEQFERIKNHYQLGKNILLLHSNRISSGFLTGVLKPVVIIPKAWVNGLQPKEIECILAHEFSHIRSKDHWINLFVQLAEMIYYFNPAVHILISHIKMDRELHADRSANDFVQSPIVYAKLILKVEEQTGKIPLFSIPFFKQRNQLRRRIESVLNIQSSAHYKENAISLYAALSCLLFLCIDLRDTNQKSAKTELIPLYTISNRVNDEPNKLRSSSIRLDPNLKTKLKEKHTSVIKSTEQPNALKSNDSEYELIVSEEVPTYNSSIEGIPNERSIEEPKVVAYYTQTEIKLDSLVTMEGDGAWVISKQGKSFQPKIARTLILLRTESVKSTTTETNLPDTVEGNEKGSQTN